MACSAVMGFPLERPRLSAAAPVPHDRPETSTCCALGGELGLGDPFPPVFAPARISTSTVRVTSCGQDEVTYLDPAAPYPAALYCCDSEDGSFT